ncbi:sulfotransferase [Aliivibrio fischeri]|uniref:sulfotransferase n=1 Tax=Aliivibrio fischeri TaxID=668 RepID=UPI0007C44CF3|nr:sulfotransferase [Aliivibrio fischeri]
MNLLCIGGWFSGNSAILDCIDSHENIKYLKSDFDILRQTNGIMDLIIEKELKKKEEIIKINIKFCTKLLFKEIKFILGKYTKYLFKSKEFHRDRQYKKRYNDNINFNISLIYKFAVYFIRCHFFEMTEDEQVAFWKNWLAISSLNEKDYVVYCNPIYYDNFEPEHKELWPKLFSPYKIILVHRNPLDQFYDIYMKEGMSDTSVARFFKGSEELEPIQRFHYIVKKIHEARLNLINTYSKDELLLISFEDFVENSHVHLNEIVGFLGLSNCSFSNSERFDAEKSCRNIGIWKSNEHVKDLIIKNSEIVDELMIMRAELIDAYNGVVV